MQRLARGLNAVLGGATANAQMATCSYAQLFLDSAGTVPDANSEDGYNQTDSSGCVLDGKVVLWAKEANYVSDFVAGFPGVGGCRGYINLSSTTWQYNSLAPLTSPTKPTQGCVVQVESNDENVANGGQANVVAVVQSVCASPCYALVTVKTQTTRQKYKCALACFGNDLNYTSSTTMTAYVSNDNGDSWTIVPGTDKTSTDGGNTWSMSSGSDQCSDQISGTALKNNWNGPPPPPSCSIPRSLSWDFQAQTLDTWSNEGMPAPPPSPNPYIHASNSTSWSPTGPPGTRGMTF